MSKMSPPVNTIAMPYLSAISIDSWSQTEPPGWMILWYQQLRFLQRYQQMGASKRFPAVKAILAVNGDAEQEATRLVWPGPTPRHVVIGHDNAIRLDILDDFFKQIQSSFFRLVGWRLVTTCQSAGLPWPRLDLHKEGPPTTPVICSFSTSPSWASKGSCRIREFSFGCENMRLYKMGQWWFLEDSCIFSAVATSTFGTTMPPKIAKSAP